MEEKLILRKVIRGCEIKKSKEYYNIHCTIKCSQLNGCTEVKLVGGGGDGPKIFKEENTFTRIKVCPCLFFRIDVAKRTSGSMAAECQCETQNTKTGEL